MGPNGRGFEEVLKKGKLPESFLIKKPKPVRKPPARILIHNSKTKMLANLIY